MNICGFENAIGLSLSEVQIITSNGLYNEILFNSNILSNSIKIDSNILSNNIQISSNSLSNLLQPQIYKTSNLIYTDDSNNTIIKLRAQNPFYPVLEGKELRFHTAIDEYKVRMIQTGELEVYHPLQSLPTGFPAGWWGIHDKLVSIIQEEIGLRFDVINLQVASGTTPISSVPEAIAAVAGSAGAIGAIGASTGAIGGVVAGGDYGSVALGTSAGILASILGYLSYQAQVSSNLSNFPIYQNSNNSNISNANLLLASNLKTIGIANGFINCNLSNQQFVNNFRTNEITLNNKSINKFSLDNLDDFVKTQHGIYYDITNGTLAINSTPNSIDFFKVGGQTTIEGNLIIDGSIKQNGILLSNVYITSNNLSNLSNTLINSNNSKENRLTFNSPFVRNSNTIALNGALVTNINTSNITDGTLAISRGGSPWITSTLSNNIRNAQQSVIATNLIIGDAGTANINRNTIPNSIARNYIVLRHNTFNANIGQNFPNPDCALIMANASGSAGQLQWGFYNGVVKYLATSVPTSIRYDIGRIELLTTLASGFIGTPGTSNIYNPYITILNSGNVGIGSILPQYKFDVNGRVNASSYSSNGILLDFNSYSTSNNSINISNILSNNIFQNSNILSTNILNNSNIASNSLFNNLFNSNSNIYTTSNAVKYIAEFEMPILVKKYGFLASVTIPVYPDGITLCYEYNLFLPNYTKTLNTGQGDPYRIFNIELWYEPSYFGSTLNGFPWVISYKIYMSNKSNPSGNGIGQSGLNICAIGTPVNINLDKFLPNNLMLLKNSINNFNYLSIISRNPADVRCIIIDELF